MHKLKSIKYKVKNIKSTKKNLLSNLHTSSRLLLLITNLLKYDSSELLKSYDKKHIILINQPDNQPDNQLDNQPDTQPDNQLERQKNNKYLLANELNIKKLITNETMLNYDEIVNHFKKYFVVDYKNYIDPIFNTTPNKLSLLTFHNVKKQLEGYLLVTIYNDKFYSYMYDMLNIRNPINISITKQSNTNPIYHNAMDNIEYGFPLKLPDSIKKQSENEQFKSIFLILNQIYKIMKYLAIVIGHNATKNKNYHCGFELVKVVFNVDENLDVKYHDCQLKKEWGNSQFDNAMYKWMNMVIFEPVVKKHTLLDVGLKSKILYFIDYEKYDKNKLFYNYNYNIKQMTRKDFDNVYIITRSQDEQFQDFNISFLESSLKKYGIKLLDLYSSLGVNPVFGWMDKYGVIDKKQYKLHYQTNFYIGSMLDNHSSITEKNNLYFMYI